MHHPGNMHEHRLTNRAYNSQRRNLHDFTKSKHTLYPGWINPTSGEQVQARFASHQHSSPPGGQRGACYFASGHGQSQDQHAAGNEHGRGGDEEQAVGDGGVVEPPHPRPKVHGQGGPRRAHERRRAAKKHRHLRGRQTAKLNKEPIRASNGLSTRNSNTMRVPRLS